ncbi:MAG: ribose-phosphate pyrophosphokinase [Pseudomonadota bacterium]|nr:ribose-phosphate pyrophosphokinase [Pseudomonadota bacterium]
MTLLFAFPEQAALARIMSIEQGDWEWRHFPDGESYVRILSAVRGKPAAILCSLNQPDTKTLPLIFLAQTLKELGAAKVTLVAPYLGYMRQDTRFHEGEAVTSETFAVMLSRYIDALITVDPHLHRHHDLKESYTCECKSLSAASLMAEWIGKNIKHALIIGPDMESEQWVKEVAEEVQAPYIVLQKTRHGDRDVEITLPDIGRYKNHTPVLIDDIISTAATMIKAVELLKAQGFADITCLATHGLFAGNAYDALQKAGAAQIITANTIPHPSNGMEVAELLAAECVNPRYGEQSRQ